MLTTASSSSQHVDFGHFSAIDGATKFAVAMICNFKSSTPAWSASLSQLGAATGAGNTNGFAIIREDPAFSQSLMVCVRNGSGSGTLIPMTFGVQRSIVIGFDGSQSAANRVTCWFDGVAQTTSQYFTNGWADTSCGTTDQHLYIGRQDTGYADQDIAELGIWAGFTANQDLADHANRRFRLDQFPTKPNFYARLINDANDTVGGKAGTLVNSPVFNSVPHPRVYG